ncbi:MAG: aldo/keto reductase, partial [Clostridiales bacterium]|nr:aldo/keto reductase [Clostridiales bacterium]
MSCRRPDGDGICPESDDARRRQNERPDYNNKTVSANGFALPALGQGACFIGERADTAQAEKAALLRGLSLGMSHIDTAEMYGGGGSERLIGEALRRNRVPRAEVVLTSKVCPWNAAPPALFASCDASLRRLGTDYLDLYLLHWRGEIALAETVAGMEELVRRGRIRRWGVSNFDVADMEELWRLPDGRNCAADQVLYHLGSRGIEFDLLPWLRA